MNGSKSKMRYGEKGETCRTENKSWKNRGKGKKKCGGDECEKVTQKREKRKTERINKEEDWKLSEREGIIGVKIKKYTRQEKGEK